MGAALGCCAGAAFRTLVPRQLFAGKASSAKIACESPLNDDEIIEALTKAPLVHPNTPKDKLPARVSSTVLSRFHQSAGPRSQAKTGDVILFDKKKGGALGAIANMVGLNQRDITKGCFTHAGIVIRMGERGDDSRMIVMESVLSKMPYDIVEGASGSRLAGAVRFYPLKERILTYPGHTFILPLREALSAEAEQRLLTAACAIWRRNPDFDVDGLVEAGFHRLPLTRALFGDRFEPEEDLEAFFCSELVGHLLETALEMPLMTNVSQLAPNDLLKMSDVFDVASLAPVRLYHGERDASMEAEYELLAEGAEEVRRQVDELRTGDVLLVKSTHAAGRLIQLGDWTHWDHVAMVVRQRGEDVATRTERNAEKPLPYEMHGEDVPERVGMFWSEFAAQQLQILEATKAGSYCYPFQELLECRGPKYSHVAVRKLEPPLTDEQCAKVEAFVQEVWGRPYDIVGNVGEFLTGLKAILSDDPGDALKNKGDEDLAKLFCSELVAEALQRAEILPEATLNSNEVLPSMFARGGAIDRILAEQGGHYSYGGKERMLSAPQSEYYELYHEARDARLGKLEYSGWVE